MKQRPKYLLDYRKDQFSQNGEDGVIEFILSKLPDKNGWCVEFGAWDGKYLSNTYNLIANHKYRAVLIEGDAEKYEVLKQNMKGFTGCVCKHVYVAIDGRNKLDDILKETPLPKHFDLLSIDIDGDDYHVWNSLKDYEPSVVLIELNAHDKPGVEKIHQPGAPLVMGITSTSITSMTNLAETKGYSLICHVGCNVIYVRSEYLPVFHEKKITPLEVFTYEYHSLRDLTLREIVTLDRTEVIRRLNEGYKQINTFGQNHFGDAWNLLHKVLRGSKRIVRQKLLKRT